MNYGKILALLARNRNYIHETYFAGIIVLLKPVLVHLLSLQYFIWYSSFHQFSCFEGKSKISLFTKQLHFKSNVQCESYFIQCVVFTGTYDYHHVKWWNPVKCTEQWVVCVSDKIQWLSLTIARVRSDSSLLIWVQQNSLFLPTACIFVIVTFYTSRSGSAGTVGCFLTGKSICILFTEKAALTILEKKS